MVRSAGGSAQLVARESGMALLRLPSGEMRRVQESCRATIGTSRAMSLPSLNSETVRRSPSRVFSPIGSDDGMGISFVAP